MSDEVIKVLDDLSERAGVVIDWTNENVMPQVLDMIDGLVKYHIVSALVLVIVSAIGLWKIYKTVKAIMSEYASNYEKERVFTYNTEFGVATTGLGFSASSICAIGAFVLTPMMVYNLISALKWLFIPEIQIIAYFSHLI